MISLPGYRVVDKLYESSRTLIYRGERLVDHAPVILKLLRSNPLCLPDLIRLRNQYAIAQSLTLPGVVQPLALERDGEQLALVMPDEGFISLQDGFAQVALSNPTSREPGASVLHTFLAIAIQLADILDGLYRHRVIHKDIKPSNILIHPITRQVKLTDFGLASQLPQETQTLQSPNVLEGTLAYMAPEQTGRMNRGIDYRSDFYALGVTFYELLTGYLPFQSHDPLELVYAHLAKEPPPLTLAPAFQPRVDGASAPAQELRTRKMGSPEPEAGQDSIPLPIASIVLKLMAKNAEDRYQSALGLKADLETCLERYQTTGAIAPFPLGQIDEMSQFNIPQKLYGREAQVQRLLAAFERVSQGSCELVLVGGYSGVGKTSLIRELLRSLTRHKGYFVAGKFDQFKRDVPLEAPLQAWRSLMRQLLTESHEQLQYWQHLLADTLGVNAQVIIDVIPELEHILGPQPPVPELGAIEARNRMVRTFQQFNQAFQRAHHPVVFFMDDGQWADVTSCQSLQTFMQNPENHHWMMIAAYRDNEVSAAHPLMQAIESVRDAGATITKIELEPLRLQDVTQLLTETLHTTSEAVAPLADLLFQKTAGNPFFLIQLLRSLHEDGLIWFDAPSASFASTTASATCSGGKGTPTSSHPRGQQERGGWRWDLAQIQQRAMTDDVVELMIGKIAKLSVPTQRMLQLAACIGNLFDLQILAIVSEQSLTQTGQELWEAIQAGLVVPLGEGYRLPQMLDASEIAAILDSGEAIAYRFLHDRVQQAAYALIPEDQKQITHLAIGRLLLQSTLETELEDRIFAIVHHWNMAIQLITDPSEKITLTQLNLIAGQKAKASSAYASALVYLETGLELLPEDRWLNQYGLTLALYAETAEVSALNAHFDQAQQFIEQMLESARTTLDKVKAYDIQIQTNIAQSKFKEALHIGQQILQLLGVTLPDADNPEVLQQQLEQVTALYVDQPVESLLHLPQMVVPEQIATMQILAKLWSAAFMSNPSLCPLIVLKQVELSLRYGNTAESTFAYAVYASILISIVSEIEAGYQFGQLALNLLNYSEFTETRTRTEVIVQNFVNPWKQHPETTLLPLLNAYQTGLETGDFEFASYAVIIYCYHSYFLGKELTVLERDMQTYAAQVEQLKQFSALTQHKLNHQAVLNLLGRADNPLCLIGDVFNEEMFSLAECRNHTTICCWHINKLVLAYLFEARSQAIAEADAAAVDLAGVAGLPYYPVFYFYSSLAYLRGLSNPDLFQREQLLEKVSANQDKMKIWATHAPMNHQHKHDLVEAERYRMQGDRASAIELYDRAIAGAKANHYIQEEALANELAAKFYLDWGKDKVAAAYMQEAYDGYARWGAKAKLMDLRTRYSQFFAPILHNSSVRSDGEDSCSIPGDRLRESLSSAASPASVLDLATVLKASQAISQEIQTERLLGTLMQVIMENAGAQTGSLILPHDGDWRVATQCPDLQSCQLCSLPLTAPIPLPLSVIHYVQRTQNAVVIDDSTAPHPFLSDSYWVQKNPKSVLCVPILNQGRLIGMVYLENQITVGAFASDRQEVVQMIASQAAISLENAQLYRTLEQQVADRTQDLSQALADLQATQQDLIQSEKMAALGQLTASIAHEINTPLGVIRAATTNITAAFFHSLHQLPLLLQQLSPQQQTEFFALIHAALQQPSLSTQAERQLRRTLQANLQAQGIPHPGQLAYHLALLRLDNVDSYGALLRDRQASAILETAYNLVLQHQNMSSIQQEVDRAAKIVFALKTYSYQNSLGEKSWVDITEGIEIALTLYQNRLKRSIQVVRQYATPLPAVFCNPDALTQVWVNLIDNAIDAMGRQGILTIDVSHDVSQLGDCIQVEITDSGHGIPADVRSRIFEPFFTTKSRGEGSGLGLDIVKQIIDEHGGSIQVASQPGQTTFTLQFPFH